MITTWRGTYKEAGWAENPDWIANQHKYSSILRPNTLAWLNAVKTWESFEALAYRKCPETYSNCIATPPPPPSGPTPKKKKENHKLLFIIDGCKKLEHKLDYLTNSQLNIIPQSSLCLVILKQQNCKVIYTAAPL